MVDFETKQDFELWSFSIDMSLNEGCDTKHCISRADAVLKAYQEHRAKCEPVAVDCPEIRECCQERVGELIQGILEDSPCCKGDKCCKNEPSPE